MATSPVKLPTRHCPPHIDFAGLDSALEKRGIPLTPSPRVVRGPSYSRQFQAHCQCQAAVKLPGSFCPGASRPHLHSHFNFAGSAFKTVACSLGLSYGSELTRQRTSLPSNSYSYCCRLLELTPQAFPKGGHPECLTYQHWAGFSPYTSPYGLAETCVFVKQSASDLLLQPPSAPRFARSSG